jgi:hypothetical protein
VLKVFLNHASEDRALVAPYFEKLRALGYDPWIDRRLLPGQDWDEEIQRAFLASDVVLIFMSPRSVKKRGYVQREIHDALERQKSLLPGDIGAIPLLLEECEVPTNIAQKLQYNRLPSEWHKVVDALALAANQRSIAIHNGILIGPFRMFARKEMHEWEGWPGYSVDLRFPHFESSILPNAAIELNEFVASRRLEGLLEARRAKIEQEPNRVAHLRASDGTPPSNFLDLAIEPVLVGDSILSFIVFEAGFLAGAAHGFHWTTTRNFLVNEDSLVRLTLEDFFSDPSAARQALARLCAQKIAIDWGAKYGTPPDADGKATIRATFPPAWETFGHFSLSSAGISVNFPPYTLGGYAVGSWDVEFTFEELKDWLKPDGPHLLAQTANAPRPEVSPDAGLPRWEFG